MLLGLAYQLELVCIEFLCRFNLAERSSNSIDIFVTPHNSWPFPTTQFLLSFHVE